MTIDASRLVVAGSLDEIEDALVLLAADADPSAIDAIDAFLREKDDATFHTPVVPRLAVRALLRKGVAGVEALRRRFSDAPGPTYASAIVEALWFAAEGRYPPRDIVGDLAERLEASTLSADVAPAAERALRDLIGVSMLDPDHFFYLVQFLQTRAFLGFGENEPFPAARLARYFAEGRIQLTRDLIDAFEALVLGAPPEETIHRFLARHPVFVDPLAATVTSKDRLGVEHITDFVIRRHDGAYLVVEIEKPQDKVFTLANDFSSGFIHAFGQVIDFQRWVEKHSEYARNLLAGIASPRGLLIIGRRRDLTPENIEKLHRFNVNSAAVEVVLFDDLVARARTLHASMFHP